MAVKTLEFRDGALYLLDQTLLPGSETIIECRDAAAVAEAISALRVRGAPAIGLAAAYGVVLAARSAAAAGGARAMFERSVAESIQVLGATRPTAVNLSWALRRMKHVVERDDVSSSGELADRLLAEADRMLSEDEETNRAMGRHGAELLPYRANVLTHCNAGALATGAFGTALGVIAEAHAGGKDLHVWVDETRPLLQGARLTAWELDQLGIPHTLITDSMAGHFMARGDIDVVIVGADRIAANGDAANKIGTYGLSVLARAHELPFYVAAPLSTLDLSVSNGGAIPIEERSPEEVSSFHGFPTAPSGTRVANPAFDVTPARLVTAIITERGVVWPPFRDEISAVAGGRPLEVISSGTATGTAN